MEATWYTTARENTAETTATKAAAANQKHVITGVYAGFSSAVTKTLIIKEDSTTRITLDVVNSLNKDGLELEFGAGAAVSAVLEASGTTGVYGSVLLSGYTK